MQAQWVCWRMENSTIKAINNNNSIQYTYIGKCVLPCWPVAQSCWSWGPHREWFCWDKQTGCGWGHRWSSSRCWKSCADRKGSDSVPALARPCCLPWSLSDCPSSMSLCWGLKQQHPVIHCLFQCRRAKKAWMPLITTMRAWNNRTVAPTACFSTRGNNKAWLPLWVGTETTGPYYPSPVSAQEETRPGCLSMLGLKQQDHVIHRLFQHMSKQGLAASLCWDWNKRTMLFIACFSTRANKAWLPLCDVAWNWNNRAMLFMEQDHVIVILQLFLVLRRWKEQGLACLCLCIGDPGPSPTELSTQDSWQNKAWLAFASVLGIQVPHLLNFQHRTPYRTRPGLPLPLCWVSRSLAYFNTGLLTKQGLAATKSNIPMLGPKTKGKD